MELEKTKTKKRFQISLKQLGGTCRRPLKSCHQVPISCVQNYWIWVISFRGNLILRFNVFYSKIVYFIRHWKKFFLYSSPEFWKTFVGLFCCYRNFVSRWLASNRNSILTFFSFPRLILKYHEPKNFCIGEERITEFRYGRCSFIFYTMHEYAIA